MIHNIFLYTGIAVWVGVALFVTSISLMVIWARIPWGIKNWIELPYAIYLVKYRVKDKKIAKCIIDSWGERRDYPSLVTLKILKKRLEKL